MEFENIEKNKFSFNATYSLFAQESSDLDKTQIQSAIPFLQNNYNGKIFGSLFKKNKDLYLFNSEFETYLISIAEENKEQSKNLDFFLQRGCANFAQMIHLNNNNNNTKNKECIIRIVFFDGELIDIGNLHIGFTDAFKQNIKSQKSFEKYNLNNDEKIINFLKQNILLNFENAEEANSYFLISNSYNIKDDEQEEQNQTESETTNQTREEFIQDFASKKSNLYLLCDKFILHIIKGEFNYNEILLINKIQPLNNRDKFEKNWIRLAKGKIFFSNLNSTKELSALASGTILKLNLEPENYLKQWDKYGDKELEILFQKAKNIGKITFIKFEKVPKGGKFFVQPDTIPTDLQEGDLLKISNIENLPIYLKNPNTTIEEYKKNLLNPEKKSKENQNLTTQTDFDEQDQQNNQENENQNETQNNDSEKQENNNKKQNLKKDISLLITEIKENSIKVETENSDDEESLANIPNSYYLILNIDGDEVQIKRREQARKQILFGTSANPLLGIILDKNSKLPYSSSVNIFKRIKPLTKEVKEKIFEHPPLARQIEAIDIALNTPDIALIQGPPGTGKTTVITAILERLNQEFDKSNNIKGKVLVSGYQHDAVDNIIARININNLPTIKFGKKSNANDFSILNFEKKVLNKCSKITDKIKKNNPNLTLIPNQKINQLTKEFDNYLFNPNSLSAIAFLNYVKETSKDLTILEIYQEACELLEIIELENQTYQNYIEILQIAENLPSTINELKTKDYKNYCLDLLILLEPEKSTKDYKILKQACLQQENITTDFLTSFLEFKQNTIKTYEQKKRTLLSQKPSDDILDLYSKLIINLKENLNITDKKDGILSEFLHELNNNTDGIIDAFSNYNLVFSATVQQSVGYDIKKYKGDLVYDTLIVDEAARVSPRDLLITLVQAEKRIILVGDHRQLPHIIDENIVNKLENYDDEQKSEESAIDQDGKIKQTTNFKEIYQESIFQYLFNRLKDLEKIDGIKRTVTLDAQFRTHPLLGKFASDNFYKLYGEAYESPLGEEHFKQNLNHLNGKAALWIDIPNSKGIEERNKQKSRFRTAEAEVIAKYIDEWIKSDAGKKLSFGVISFYKAQVDAVYESLQKYGITQKKPNGFEIVDEFAFFKDGKERLRLGTVDAFQGMEFDIVLLSMVRTRNLKDIKNSKSYKNMDEIEKDRFLRGLFGHLMSKNRLCVSVSRQKKVLALVGDATLATSEYAQDAVPELKNFYDLCKNNGVVLNEK